MQNEITKPSRLLNSSGKLNQKGWAKSLLLDYDRTDIRAAKHRIKEWDYYLVTNSDFAVALTIDDNSYMGLMSISLIDFNIPTEKTTSIIVPLTWGKVNLPSCSKTGDVAFKNDKVDISFVHMGGDRVLRAKMKKFDGANPIEISITLSDEPKDSMVIATPFEKDEKAFYYNQKIVGMSAEGYAKYKCKTYEFKKGTSFGLLDWGRGVWTYDNTWYWGVGQGMVEGEVFGFNIGYGFGDTSAATENMLFWGGVSHKLSEVKFNIPQKDGKDDYLSPWTFTSDDNRFETRFVPIIDRDALTSVGVIMSDQHQVFGKMNGKVVLDDGRELLLKDFLCFAEKVRNKW